MSNIKKTDLIRIIESVVRECIKERRAQLNEAGLTSEKSDSKITALDDIVTFIGKKAGKKGLKDKNHFQYLTKALYKHQMGTDPDDDAVASAVDNYLGSQSEPQVAEASYKVVSPNAVDTSDENKALAIQTDPEVNEDFDADEHERHEFQRGINQYNKRNPQRFPCPTCKAPNALSADDKRKGYQCNNCADAEEGTGFMQEASYKVVAPRQATDAKEDKARKIQTEPKVNEASYKVVAPRQATDAKEDKARKIQTEPKVNETAFKKQGPSLKTFKDSPQFPDAVNDPENQ